MANTFGFNASAQPAGGGFALSALSSATNPTSSAPSTQIGGFGSLGSTLANKPTLQFGIVSNTAAAPATSTAPLAFGSLTAKSAAGGIAAPSTAAPSFSGGIKLGSTNTSGGFGFGTPAAPSTGGLGGLATTTNTTTGLTLGALGSAAPKLGAPTTTASGLSFGALGGTTPQLGGTLAAPSTSGGLKLGGLGGTTSQFGGTLAASSTTGSLSLGGLGGTTSQLGTALAAPSTSGSLKLGGLSGTTSQLGTAPATTGGLTVGGLGGAKLGMAPVATSSSGGLTLGGLGGTNTVAATTSSSVNKGLGGVDPSTGAQNANKAAGAGDGKRVKEGNMPNELVETVTNFKAYVKEQKDIGTKMSAVTSQQMSKVQEQTKSLKHLLSTVAMGLHRNVVALDKLKRQTSQELHNVEMAHRTKETPAGLQYENNAPNQYFEELLEAFDGRMALYRKLIEDTEGYLVGAQQGTAITPRDLFVCLKRLHETFIALAAQLQGIHEQIKEQKEHYLAYRKVFHNDEADVFEKRKKISSDKNKLSRTQQPLGPTPFTGLSNYAAMMMTAAMNRQAPQQQPGAPAFGGLGTAQPPTGGLFGGPSAGTSAFGGFGAGASQSTSLFGGASTATKPLGFGFGAATTTSAPSAFGFPSASTSTLPASKPLGFGFGSTATTAAPTGGFGFGSAAASTTLNKPTSFGFGNTGFGSTVTAQPSGGSLFGSQAKKPLGMAIPNQNLTSSAPAFNLQPAPHKRSNLG